jgi:hypothetical protein
MENRFHRYLNLPFEIAKPNICNEYPDDMKHLDINDYVDTNIDNWLDKLNLHVGHTEVFYTPPNGGKLPIHSDESTLDDHVKINITWGPEEGVMRWWKANKTQVFTDIEDVKANYKGLDVDKADEFSHRQHTNVLALEEDCTLIYEANTNRPSLVNVGVLHSTYNPTAQGRWTLCFVPAVKGGHGYIYWDEAQEYFKDYIITGYRNGN